MISKINMLQLLLTSTTIGAIPHHIRSTEIKWGACVNTINATLPIECANFTVPLDYSDQQSNSTLNLELLKVPAINGPSRGSILFNFGGPGIEVRSSLAGRGLILQAVTGGHHDLIGFDPRGTANTLTFSCFADPLERIIASLATGGKLQNSSDSAPGYNWAAGAVKSETCYQFPDARNKGGLVNTAFVARDLMQIVDALGEDGLLRYWGFSYGTALGATVVSMFPEKMDKVVLDGVVNPHEWYHWADVQMSVDTDATFSGFIEECLKAPDKCALARNNMSASNLEATIYNLIEDIKFHPIPFRGAIINDATIKTLIRPSLYSVSRWEPLGRALQGLLTGNLTQYSEGSADILASTPDVLQGSQGDDSPYGIQCSDKALRLATLEEATPIIEELGKNSKLLGEVFQPLLSICAQWKLEPKERYGGDFNAKTKTPVLVIGNTYDPATSIQAAYNVSAGFAESVVLKHNGYGHCTTGQPSICTSKAIRSYFMDGVLPAPGVVCEVDVPPFSGKTYNDLLPQLGFNMSKIQSI